MAVNLKKQVSLLLTSTVLAAFSVTSIINFSDPYNSSWLTFGFFYLSLFLFCLGIFTLAGLGLRQALWPGLYVVNLGNAFRQSVLISILISVSFMLMSQDLLFWWVEASLILFLAAIEVFVNLKV